MITKDVIKCLVEKEVEFKKIISFSKLPGIYAIFFVGSDFPLLGDEVSKHQIIYIGKTESSQEKRDANTHFSSGKTGSSTVRKSIGSLLCEREGLIPIPRNSSDYNKKKYSHFKFDSISEEKITKWMVSNLALSFFEFPKSKQEIEKLETEIIAELIPILNISKNQNNPFKYSLQQLRKNCALIARNNSIGIVKKVHKELASKDSKMSVIIGDTFNSDSILVNNITDGDVKSRKVRIVVANKHLFPEEKIGQPNSYNLDFYCGDIMFTAEYKIGSKDGKSRSGVLKLGDKIYKNVLTIQKGSVLRIKMNDNGRYDISINSH